MIDVIIELAREGVFSKLLYGDLVLMCKTVAVLMNNFRRWNEDLTAWV